MANPPADAPYKLTITPQDPPEGVLGLPPGVDPFMPKWQIAQAGDDYARIRAQRSSQALEEEALRRHGMVPPAAPAAPAGSGPSLPVSPQTPPPAAPAPGSAPPPPTIPQGTAAPIGPGAAPVSSAGVNLEALPAAAGAVAQDIGQGIVQAPRAVAGGAMDAIRETVEAADSLGTWLQSVAPVKPSVRGTQLGAPFAADEALQEIFGNDVRLPGIETFGRALEDPAALLASIVPKLDKPDSVSGGMAHDVAQFVTGFFGGGKVLKGLGLGTKGVAAGLSRGAISDALAFDPNEDNLAALLKKHDVLKGPVQEFLATDPKDGEGVNRLRRAVEGLGLGVATEGLIATLRLYRANRWAKSQADGGTVDQAKAELERLRQQHGSLDESAFKGLGDASETGPLVKVEPKAADAVKATDTGVPDDVAARAIAGAQPPVPQGIQAIAGDGPRLIVNFARINGADDVKQLMRDAAEAFKGDIDAARRGVQTHEDTKKLADALGMTVDDLLSRRQGQPFNAEEALGARRLWVASTEKLLETARLAASPQASQVDLFNFRRMLATHYAIQAEVIAARTESARALNAWNIPVAAGDIERSKAVTEALVNSGGDVTARDLARKLQVLADSGVDADMISGLVRKGVFARGYDAYAEFYINALLSSPKTHIVNTMSNSMALLSQVYERRVAEELSKLRAPDGVVQGVAPGEAQAMLFGIIEANRDAWRMAWLALKEGRGGQALGKADAAPRAAAISAEAFGLQEGALARTVDWLGVATRTPSRLLGAEDEFFKTIGYRMELHAQALRMARGEGLEGQALRERIADLVRNPPETVRLQSIDAATYATFTSYAGDFAEAVIKARDAVPFAGVYLLPFVKTPVNIFKYSFERTPLAFTVRQWREDIAAGGARADIAMARMATGTSIMLAAFDYADRGLVTGGLQGDASKREVQQRQGVQKYSVRIGDQWVSYNRLDPFGLLIGFAADSAEIIHRYEIDNEKLDEFGEILAAATGAVSAATIDKSWLQGMGNFFAFMEDPKRNAFNYAGQIVGSNVPSLLNTAAQLDDPVVREKMKLLDYAQARLVEFSKGLTPRRDLWGAPVMPSSGFGTAFDALSPVQVSTSKVSPVDAEMQRLNLGIERIDKKASFDGTPVNFRDFPRIYDAYVRLAGNELKLPIYDNKGAKDFLDAVVSGKSPWSEIYNSQSDGPDGGKAEFIRGVVATYRKAARQELLSAPDYADFQAAFDKLQRDDRAKKFIGGAVPDVGASMPQVTPPRVNPSPLRQDVPGASGAPSPSGGVRIQ